MSDDGSRRGPTTELLGELIRAPACRVYTPYVCERERERGSESGAALRPPSATHRPPTTTTRTLGELPLLLFLRRSPGELVCRRFCCCFLHGGGGAEDEGREGRFSGGNFGFYGGGS